MLSSIDKVTDRREWSVPRFSRAAARYVLLCALTVSAITAACAQQTQASEVAANSSQNTNIEELVEKLPLAFEENKGQADPKVKFLSRAKGYQLFLTSQEAVMVFEGVSKPKPQARPVSAVDQERQATVVRMRFEGSNEAPVATGIEPLEFKTNYFIGADPSHHVTNVTSHAKVRYASVYPGIDLLYYGNQQRLEYDLVVAPGAKPQQIKLSFAGADKVSLSKAGDLVLQTAVGDVTFHKPIAYQEIEGRQKAVDAKYILAANGNVGFRFAQYDINRPLVIDPIVTYSTFVWGKVRGVAVDTAGNAYIVGTYNGKELPATGGYQPTLAGITDAYIAKIDPTGSKLVYATYLGARRAGSSGAGIGVDAAGNAYIFGTTDSSAFPVTPGAYQTAYRAGRIFILHSKTEC
jgi:hypothetical protein